MPWLYDCVECMVPSLLGRLVLITCCAILYWEMIEIWMYCLCFLFSILSIKVLRPRIFSENWWNRTSAKAGHHHVWYWLHKMSIFLPFLKLKIKTHSVASFYRISTAIFNDVIKSTKALTHRGQVTYICVGKISIIGSDNGLSPSRCQAIIWTNAGILLILRTNFSETLIRIQTFSFKKMHFKMAAAKWRPFCLGLNELKNHSNPEKQYRNSL